MASQSPVNDTLQLIVVGRLKQYCVVDLTIP